MKKLILCILLFSLSILSAEETVTETVPAEKTPEKTGKFFFADIKAGFGADFTGNPGRIGAEHDLNNHYTPYAVDILQDKLRNQFGLSLGLDFNWRVFQKTGGEGAGELYFGFGFSFQYWIPTSSLTKDDSYDTGSYDNRRSVWAKAALHYMRIPLTLNILYDFKVNAGVLRRVGPVFSAGINNNLFIFKYETEPENEEIYKPIHDSIDFHQLSFIWSIGLNFLFADGCFVSVSVGGDKGSEKIKYYLLSEETENVLYHHHEFMMFETGYRF